MAKVACALSRFLGAAVPFAHAAHPLARAPTFRSAARKLLQCNIRKARAGERSARLRMSFRRHALQPPTAQNGYDAARGENKRNWNCSQRQSTFLAVDA